MLLLSLGFQVLSQMKMAIDLLSPAESSSLTSSVHCLMHTHRHCCVTQCIPEPNSCGKIPVSDRMQGCHPRFCGAWVLQEGKNLDSCAAQLEQQYRDHNLKRDFWSRHIKSRKGYSETSIEVMAYIKKLPMWVHHCW